MREMHIHKVEKNKTLKLTNVITAAIAAVALKNIAKIVGS
jgi:hypothetical protein